MAHSARRELLLLLLAIAGAGPVAAAVPSIEEVRKMKIRDLRQLLDERGVDCDGCIEKFHLVARVEEALHLPVIQPGQAIEGSKVIKQERSRSGAGVKPQTLSKDGREQGGKGKAEKRTAGMKGKAFEDLGFAQKKSEVKAEAQRPKHGETRPRRGAARASTQQPAKEEDIQSEAGQAAQLVALVAAPILLLLLFAAYKVHPRRMRERQQREAHINRMTYMWQQEQQEQQEKRRACVRTGSAFHKLPRWHAGAEDTGENCSVCFEDLGDRQRQLLVQLPCGHKYHSKCINAWLKRCMDTHGSSHSCPICRHDVAAPPPLDRVAVEQRELRHVAEQDKLVSAEAAGRRDEARGEARARKSAAKRARAERVLILTRPQRERLAVAHSAGAAALSGEEAAARRAAADAAARGRRLLRAARVRDSAAAVRLPTVRDAAATVPLPEV